MAETQRRRGGRRRHSLSRREAATGFAFVLPALLGITIFALIPAGAVIWLSLTKWHLIGSPKFVGLANYQALLDDSRFVNSLVVTLQMAVGIAIPGALIALVLGLLLLNVRRGVTAYQTILFLPLVPPSVVAAIVWSAMYVGNGVFNSASGLTIPWLTNPGWALFSIILLLLWTNLGYYTLLMVAGLQEIPMEVLEAASVDGAGPVQRIRHVIVPLMRPVLLFVLVVATTDALTLFAQPQLLTQGGPNDATETLSLLIYQTAFNFTNGGKASAMAVVLLALALLAALVNFRLLGNKND